MADVTLEVEPGVVASDALVDLIRKVPISATVSFVSSASITGIGGASTFAASIGRIRSDAFVSLRSDNIPVEADYRLFIVGMDGERIAELANAVPLPVAWAVAGHTNFSFVISSDDPQAALCQPLENEIQVYRGNRLLLWGVMLRPSSDNGGRITIQCQDLSYYFTRRLIGQIPRRNLIGDHTGPAPLKSWETVSLPRSSPRTPPARSYDLQTKYNEFPALALSSSAGRETRTLDNDTIFNGDTLTSAGRTEFTNIVSQTFGARPTISVRVHDDNTLARKASKRLAQRRCDAITDFIHDIKPNATVKATNDAYRDPVARNNTAANRKQNRRTVVTFKSGSGVRGQKQIARHRVKVRNPGQDQRKREITLSAYTYIKNVQDFASAFAGIELVRYDPRRPHKDPKWAKEGYKRVMQKETAPLGKGTPLRTWIRSEVTITLPNDGKYSLLEARLYVPNGDVNYDEVWLTASDSLWYKDEEQGDIIRDLVEHAQDEEMGKSNLNISTNIADTGVKRTRDFLWADRYVVYDALQDFQTLADGVEWDIECTPTERVFTTYFPRKGKDTDVVLANDANLAGYTVDVDGTQISTTVLIASDTDTDVPEERVAQDATIMGGLVLEKVYLSTPNSPASSWRAQSERGLARYRRPVTIPQVTLRPDLTDEMIERLVVGDRVYVAIRDQWLDLAQKYRITEMTLDPATDQIGLSLYPEDLEIKALLNYRNQWRYFHQDQRPIVGANGTRPVQSNKEFAARDFDDSGWSLGKAGFGWVKEPAGGVTQNPAVTPETLIPAQHEVWMRRTVNCTGDMVISARLADWGFVYVNGNLVTGTYVSGYNVRILGRPHMYVPREWLDPSGVQVIAVHAQYDPRRYNSDRIDSLHADVRVRGTYDPRAIT